MRPDKSSLIPKIKSVLKPLLDKKCISLAYVYGSFISSKEFRDIDILIVYDDFSCTSFELKKLEKKAEAIQTSQKLNLHIQPLKGLSKWWGLIIEGEPWIISSIKNCLPILDRGNILKEIRDLVKVEKTYNREHRATLLLESSDRLQLENREILLKSISTLSHIAVEAAQIYFLLKKRALFGKEDIASAAENESQPDFQILREIIDLESKMERGHLSEFTAENFDYYLSKLTTFILFIEEELGKD